ncbi:FmdB family zinc ribbon protein [Rickettsiella endosymbiont of Rhagonycha lignosa]
MSEYQCKACGHTFDTVQSFSEEPLTDCRVKNPR